MTKPVRWGVLGASYFATEIMGPAIHAAKGAELVALGTTNTAKGEAFRAVAPTIKVHGSYGDLLADPEVEAVYISLPNHLHVEWSLRAIQAGKHVLCEKPLAMHASEVDRLIRAQDDSGLLVAEAFMILHHPQWIRARELVQGGAIGRLVHVEASFTFDMGALPQNIRNRPETGGGALRDVGGYLFGAARFISGEEPVAVTPVEVRWENGVDVLAFMTACFPSFTFAGLVSLRMNMRQEVVVHGDKGLLRMQAPWNPGLVGQAEIILEKDPGRTQVNIERFHRVDQYVLQVEAFVRGLRDFRPFPCPLEFSRGTQRAIDLVIAQARPSKAKRSPTPAVAAALAGLSS